VNPFRTVGGRLALALLVVVGGALGIVYVLVVPLYRSSLVDARLGDLRHTAARIAERPRQASGEVFPSAAWIEDEALPVAGGARVVVFSAPPLLEPVADSNGGTSRDVEHDPLARRAASARGVVAAAVNRDGSTYAEAAVALRNGPLHADAARDDPVLLVATPLHSELEAAEVVRHRVLVAASAATAFAIVLGYALAGLFARRIRRLELAAERIAAGSFDEPVLDASRDELGQLARAFDRMRLRLASLDQARNEFIANASHELRTPLFSLAGFLELLDDEELDAVTRDEFLAEMSAQVARLAKLATDLLDLSRLDAGRLTVAEDAFDLGAAGDLLVAELGPRAAAAGHVLEADGRAGPHALGDEARVLQIGRILIDNALVHTPPGTRVTVSAESRGGAAMLSVRDDGPGIPEDAQEAVFTRFFRLGGAVASGSGLGLAIARELAELMHGHIELSSRPGCTRFTLVLPPDVAARSGELAAAGRG
jgi:signal transduction histidine kinase